MLSALAVVQITVLTMSPGGDLFARFGHTAIRVDDEAGARVYNFGAFKANDPHLASQFLHNRIPYYLSVNEPEVFEWKYRNRTMVGQLLALDDDEARHLSERLAFTLLPENRSYRYDWFRNNCTTKARDFIDETLGGKWRAQLDGKAPRYHGTIRALLADALWSLPSLFTAFSIGLNARVDEPLDAWQELSMPFDLMHALSLARRSDGRPLVASQWIWEGPAPRARREPRWLQPLFEALLLFLLAVGALGRGRMARVVAGIALSTWGALSTLVALWIIFWSAIAYPDTFLSVNLIGWSPLAAPLVVVGVRLARGRLSPRARRLGSRLIALLSVATAVELLLHLSGVGRQAHVRFSAYALAALALSWLTLRNGCIQEA